MSETITQSLPFHGKVITLEAGEVANSALASVVVRYGETICLSTVCCGPCTKANISGSVLFTATHYIRAYALSIIPSGSNKREGRPADKEILTSRVIDRSLRPLFYEGYGYDTQLNSFLLSYDFVSDSDFAALLACAVTMAISPIPLRDIAVTIRVGIIDSKLVINPDVTALDSSDMDMLITCTDRAIIMMEGFGKEVPDQKVIELINFAFESAQPLLSFIKDFALKINTTKWRWVSPKVAAREQIQRLFGNKIAAIGREADQVVRAKAVADLEIQVRSSLGKSLSVEEFNATYLVKSLGEIQNSDIRDAQSESSSKEEEEESGIADSAVIDNPMQGKNLGDDWISSALKELIAISYREGIVETGRRLDGRGFEQIRTINTKLSFLPRQSGSVLFTRGDTQALAVVTLGTTQDEYTLDGLQRNKKTRFMLHYNFMPFAVGEASPSKPPSRREIGHGTLARESLKILMPTKQEFPYTVRIVVEILRSNGSSSMAAVCAAILALIDAGIPIKALAAGIAIGLVRKGDKWYILIDMTEKEDHIGDMDFKLIGTHKGITGLQMDVSCLDIGLEMVSAAIAKGRIALTHILEKMRLSADLVKNKAVSASSKLISFCIERDKIKEIAGRLAREVQELTGVRVIEVDSDGTVYISALEAEAAARARDMIKEAISEPEIGLIYDGLIVKIFEFGVMVKFLINRQGLVHLSEMTFARGFDISTVMKEGDRLKVMLIGIDSGGKYKLSLRRINVENEIENQRSLKRQISPEPSYKKMAADSHIPPRFASRGENKAAQDSEYSRPAWASPRNPLLSDPISDSSSDGDQGGPAPTELSFETVPNTEDSSEDGSELGAVRKRKKFF